MAKIKSKKEFVLYRVTEIRLCLNGYFVGSVIFWLWILETSSLKTKQACVTRNVDGRNEVTKNVDMSQSMGRLPALSSGLS